MGGLAFLGVGAHSLWLLSGFDATMLRVDPRTARPLGWVPELGSCGQPCGQVYFARGSVWVPTVTDLLRIDPSRMPA